MRCPKQRGRKTRAALVSKQRKHKPRKRKKREFKITTRTKKKHEKSNELRFEPPIKSLPGTTH